ncbi:type II toxin-antitoxin system Phd/YefM family antitoxin [Actibacterium lipolyticum]|uniref:type II toxin-antitoxin system Phd/YefM family antitoxin n=1 Tax=Actibacterium lipolyticum TaxID=1524263 RepID=UPI001595BE4C|nr:type II toxin-antitoxin system Phd/YefM family antitoxin [Actibacterium lipolyticum]
MVKRVNVTDLRPRLTGLLGVVEHGQERVIVMKHGRQVAAIVSMKDYARVWDAEEEELYGPINPETGRRRGALLTMADMLTGKRWR